MQKQIERGIGILHRLNDLEEEIVGKYSLRIKLFKGQKFYDESQLEILETIVRNWQDECITCLDLLCYDKEGFISPFQSNSIYAIIDRRKDLVYNVEYGLRFLRSLINEVEKEIELPHFPSHSTKEEGIRLFNNLTNDSFMQVSLDSWLFLMGFVEQRPEHVVTIKWMGTKEQLRLMLRLLFESLLNNKVISVAMIERLTPMCFIDKNGKPLKLAKAREESSWRTDRLKEFFRPNPTSSETL